MQKRKAIPLFLGVAVLLAFAFYFAQRSEPIFSPVSCKINLDCADGNYTTLDYCSNEQCVNYVPDRRFTILPINSSHSSFVKKAVWFIGMQENNYTLNYIADNFDLFGSDTFSWFSLNSATTGDECEATLTTDNCVSGKCAKLQNINCPNQLVKQNIGKLDPGEYTLSFDFYSIDRKGSIALRNDLWKNASCDIVGKTIKYISRQGNNQWQHSSENFLLPETDECGESTANQNYNLLIYDYNPAPPVKESLFDNIFLSKNGKNFVQNYDFEEGTKAWHSEKEAGCAKINGTFEGKFKNAIYYSPYQALSVYSPKIEEARNNDLVISINGREIRRVTSNDIYRIIKQETPATSNLFSNEFLSGNRESCGLNIFFRDNIVFPPDIANWNGIKDQLPAYYQNYQDWIVAINSTLLETTKTLNQQGYKQIINTLQYSHRETAPLIDSVDGAMMEHFLPYSRFDLQDTTFIDDWIWTISTLKEWGERNKTMWVQAFDNRNNQTVHDLDTIEIIKDQRFNFATFLLAKYNNTYYSYKVHNSLYSFYGASLNYFPEWDIDIGEAIGDYYNISESLFIRDFEKGKVIVNPTATTHTIQLDQEYQDIEGVNKSGTVTLSPREELILFSKPEEFCGDNICNNEESCSSCSQDCGSCPAPGGGSGGGGGSGSYIPPKNKTDKNVACISSWKCTDWSDCIEGKQTRDCTDELQCASPTFAPETERECELEKTVLAEEEKSTPNKRIEQISEFVNNSIWIILASLLVGILGISVLIFSKRTRVRNPEIEEARKRRLIGYIKENINKGYSPENLDEIILRTGSYSKEEINFALRIAQLQIYVSKSMSAGVPLEETLNNLEAQGWNRDILLRYWH